MTNPLPSEAALRRLGVTELRELPDAKQSRVFAARFEGGDVVVKFVDGRYADRGLLGQRMQAVEDLAGRHAEVVAPVRLEGELVRSIDGWLMIVLPLIRGSRLDPASSDHARTMGNALAHLHAAMARLDRYEIPPVAPLADAPTLPGWQLLHGDFNVHNLFHTTDGLRILDFDDCGYGPIEYDVANSLYMVLFDADVGGQPDRYRTFREPFLEGYSGRTDRALDPTALEAMLELRIEVLGRWLDDLTTAPIGIRTATNEWHETLRSFVRRQGAGPGDPRNEA